MPLIDLQLLRKDTNLLQLNTPGGTILAWGSSPIVSPDVALERNMDGLLQVTDAQTASSLRDLMVRKLQINAGTGIMLKDATGELQVRTLADDAFRTLRASQFTASNYIGEPLSNTVIRGVASGAIQFAKSDFTAYWSINDTSGFLQSNLSTGNLRAGTFLLQNVAGTDAPTLVQFGGTTASFPASKRSGARWQFRLADDSSFAGMDGLDVALGTVPAVAGTLRLPTGGTITARNSTNTADHTLLSFNSVATDECVVGSLNAPTRLRTLLTIPGAPLANGEWWVDASGVSPNRTVALKVQDGGTTRTIASVVF